MRRTHRTSAFTLIELITSLAITTLLVGSMASAIVLASRALPSEDELSVQLGCGLEAIERIRVDLGEAVAIVETESRALSFRVPDRGQESAGDEWIRYTWSGTPGDPLMLELNNQPATFVCANVHDFSITYNYKERLTKPTPVVLFVCGQTSPLSTNDQTRITLIQSWGFSVRVLADHAAADVFATTERNCDVVYLSGSTNSLELGSKLSGQIPIVSECGSENVSLGFCDAAGTLVGNSITIVESDHVITRPFGAGPVVLASLVTTLNFAAAGTAPGATVLARLGGLRNALLALEQGVEMANGSPCPSRRVMLAWGGALGFDFALINDNARTLTRRALAWASTPLGLASVTVTLQVGNDPANRIETTVQLHNVPEKE